MAQLHNLELFVTSESENLQNEVTEKPLEDGADISDHINISPDTLSISFIVSSNGQEIANQLRKLRNNKQVYTYISEQGKTYQNMAIKSLSIPTNANIKDGFSGSINLQQVQIIEQETTGTNLGQDPATNQEVTADNTETPKKEYQTASISENNTYFDQIVGGNNA